MKEEDRLIIKNEIASLVQLGQASLLLGAGFSILNEGGHGKLPGGDKLKSIILDRCGKKSGAKTTLKDAYQLGQREIEKFDDFLANCFTVKTVFDWQKRIFHYAWGRVYTTNIDNVLNVAEEHARKTGAAAGEFKFFNYTDEGLISSTIGSIPVVTIHGTCDRLQEGFVFSSLEYAKVSSKILDWHNDLAARLVAGGLVVVGNQLDESDFDTYVSRRTSSYGGGGAPKNWIVMPEPDEIKAENYRAAGFQVIDATAEDFFNEIFRAVKPKSVGEIILDSIPSVKRAASDVAAMTWFRGAFRLVFAEIERAASMKGILRHFITGADPDWFYIVHDAYAKTLKSDELTEVVSDMMSSNDKGIGMLHVTGPSGSGKTTALRAALKNISRNYNYIYEFDDAQSMDEELLRSIIGRFTGKSIFVFYSASEYYYALKEVADRLRDRGLPYCLFVLEDRTSDYKKNVRQLLGSGVVSSIIEFGELRFEDAASIAQKIEDGGLNFSGFSEFPLERRAGIILDKERGYGGDLLSALFSLTTHENFERKIYQDYNAANGEIPRKIIDLVAIVNHLGHQIPLNYVAGAIGERINVVSKFLSEDLAGILSVPPNSAHVRCRHRVIADYYFKNCIAGDGRVDMLVSVLEFLSRQFLIEDIKHHPLPYKIYRDLISFEFIYDAFFPEATRAEDCERLYHEAQRFFGRDGIFWLHYGRYYRKIGRLSEAVDCFRTGLDFYSSFQTRHSLGTALLELYIEQGGADSSLYDEGVSLLEREQAQRGAYDAYPTTTLIGLLLRVLDINANNDDVKRKIKDCVNFGIKNFKDDPYFSRYMRRAISRI